MTLSSLSGALCCVFLLLFAAASPLFAKSGIRYAEVEIGAVWRSTCISLILLLFSGFGNFKILSAFSSLSGFKQWIFFLLGLGMAGGAWLLYNAALKSGTAVRTFSLLFVLPLPLFLISLWIIPETRGIFSAKAGFFTVLAMLCFLAAALLLCMHQDGKWVRYGLFTLLLAAGARLCFRFTPLSLAGEILPLCILLFTLLSWLSLLLRGRPSRALDIRLRGFLLLLCSALATAGGLLFYRLAAQKSGESLALLFLSLSPLLLLPFAMLFLRERLSKTEATALVFLTAATLLHTLPSIV